MGENLLKSMIDCEYFLASPLSCNRGIHCEYRHSEMARENTRYCKFWFAGTCLNPSCHYRHPRLLPKPAKASSESGPAPSQPQQSNKVSEPCYFHSKGFCFKGETCRYLHAPDVSMSEELQKKNTDCKDFLASPVSCNKGGRCEYRHSEMARENPANCRFWLSGACRIPTCPYKHPEPPVKPAEASSSEQSNKSLVPCAFFSRGYCFKGEKCVFSHVREDLLSLLIDDVLVHILSLLPTKYAFRTSVLSRRWMHLWEMVPVIDIRSSILGSRDTQLPFFFNTVMRRHMNLKSVRRFHIDWVDYSSYKLGGPHIDPALRRELEFWPELEEVEFCFPWRDEESSVISRRLPDSFYSLAHLKVAELISLTVMASEYVSLPSLETLKIFRCSTSMEAIRRLLSGCPALWDLDLWRCHYEDALEEKQITVSMPSLKFLNICADFESSPLCIMAFEVPELQALELENFTRLQYGVGQAPFPGLDVATIYTSHFEEGSHQDLIDLLNRLSNVSILNLNGRTARYLRSGGADVQLAPFPYLYQLTCSRSQVPWIEHIFMGNLAPGLAIVDDFSDDED